MRSFRLASPQKASNESNKVFGSGIVVTESEFRSTTESTTKVCVGTLFSSKLVKLILNRGVFLLNNAASWMFSKSRLSMVVGKPKNCKERLFISKLLTGESPGLSKLRENASKKSVSWVELLTLSDALALSIMEESSNAMVAEPAFPYEPCSFPVLGDTSVASS